MKNWIVLGALAFGIFAFTQANAAQPITRIELEPGNQTRIYAGFPTEVVCVGTKEIVYRRICGLSTKRYTYNDVIYEYTVTLLNKREDLAGEVMGRYDNLTAALDQIKILREAKICD